MTLASELCSDCGLCCDGALFSSVSLEAADLVTARAHRLPVLETAQGCRLELPCPALRGVLCEIYDERPECCAEFVCELLGRVDDRRLSLDQAQMIIDETRSIRARVRAATDTTPWWLALRSAAEAERSNTAWASDHAALLDDLKALEKLIRRRFWG